MAPDSICESNENKKPKMKSNNLHQFKAISYRPENDDERKEPKNKIKTHVRLSAWMRVL